MRELKKPLKRWSQRRVAKLTAKDVKEVTLNPFFSKVGQWFTTYQVPWNFNVTDIFVNNQFTSARLKEYLTIRRMFFSGKDIVPKGQNGTKWYGTGTKCYCREDEDTDIHGILSFSTLPLIIIVLYYKSNLTFFSV